MAISANEKAKGLSKIAGANSKIAKFIENYDMVELPSRAAKPLKESSTMGFSSAIGQKRKQMLESRVKRLEDSSFRKMMIGKPKDVHSTQQVPALRSSRSSMMERQAR